MVEWSMNFEELAQERRSEETTEMRTRKRKRSKSPGSVVKTSGSNKKTQHEAFESLPKLNNGEESNGSANKSFTNGRKKTGHDMDKLPIITENGKSGGNLPNLRKNSSSTKLAEDGADKMLSPELLVLPHVKPVQNSKPNRKNVWE